MAFQATANSQVNGGGADSYIKARDHADGDVLVTGVFIKKYVDQFGKDCCVFQTDDGKTVGINHSKKFEEAMVGVLIGSLCQVVKAGSFTLEEGPYKGTIMQLFNVLVDEENSNPVSAPVTTAPLADEEQAPFTTDDTGPAMAQTPAPEAAPAAAAAAVAGENRGDLLAKFRAKTKG